MSKIDDWRLQGQESLLKDTVFCFKLYEPFSAIWDHDHCEFCGAKFSATAPEALRQGFVSLENKWLCATCFNDFKDQFNLQLVTKNEFAFWCKLIFQHGNDVLLRSILCHGSS